MVRLAEDLHVLAREAEEFFSQRDWDLALEKYQNILQVDPQNEEACEKLARVFAIRGLITEVISTYFQLLRILQDKGELDLAIEVARWIMQLQPDNDKARLSQIDILRKKGANEEVVQQSLQLARLYIELGQGDQSIELLKRAQEMDPDNLELGYELAEMYVSDGHIQDGARQFRRIANSFLQKGQLDKAADAFKRMKVIQADDPSLLFTLGNIYVTLGRLGDAEVEFRSILRHDLNHLDALMALGNVCQQKGQFRDAILAFKKILTINPQDNLAKEKLGELLQAQGNINDAIKEYLSAAHAYQSVDDTATAIRLYQRVATLDPTNPTACRELANMGAPVVVAETDEPSSTYQPVISPIDEPEPQPPLVDENESGAVERPLDDRTQGGGDAPEGPQTVPRGPSPAPCGGAHDEIDVSAATHTDMPGVRSPMGGGENGPSGLMPRGEGGAGKAPRQGGLAPRSGITGARSGALIPKREGAAAALKSRPSGSDKPSLVKARGVDSESRTTVSEKPPLVRRSPVEMGMTIAEPQALAEEAFSAAPAAVSDAAEAATSVSQAEGMVEAAAVAPQEPPQASDVFATSLEAAHDLGVAEEAHARLPADAADATEAARVSEEAMGAAERSADDGEGLPTSPGRPPIPASGFGGAPTSEGESSARRVPLPPGGRGFGAVAPTDDMPLHASIDSSPSGEGAAPPPQTAHEPTGDEPMEAHAVAGDASADPMAEPHGAHASSPPRLFARGGGFRASPQSEPPASSSSASPHLGVDVSGEEPLVGGDGTFFGQPQELSASVPAPEPVQEAAEEPPTSAAAASLHDTASETELFEAGDGYVPPTATVSHVDPDVPSGDKPPEDDGGGQALPTPPPTSSDSDRPDGGVDGKLGSPHHLALGEDGQCTVQDPQQIADEAQDVVENQLSVQGEAAQDAMEDPPPQDVSTLASAREAPQAFEPTLDAQACASVEEAPQDWAMAGEQEDAEHRPSPPVYQASADVSDVDVQENVDVAAADVEEPLAPVAPEHVDAAEAESAAHVISDARHEEVPADASFDTVSDGRGALSSKDDTPALDALSRALPQTAFVGDAAAEASVEASHLEDYLRAGDAARAILAFRAYLQENPRDAGMRTRFAALLFDFGLIEEAAEEYLQLARGDPNNLDVLQRLVEIYLWSDDDARAVELLLSVSASYRQQGDGLQAFQALLDALTVDRDNARARMELAELYRESGAPDLATWHLRLLAQIADERNDAAVVLDTCRRLYEAGGSTRDKARLADALARYGQREEAAGHFRELAAVAQSEGAVNDARVALERLLELTPGDASALEQLISIYQASGDDTPMVDRLRILASNASEKGDADAALRLFEEVVRRAPSNAKDRQTLVELYLDKGMLDAARAESQALFQSWERDGMSEAAIPLLERFIAVAPDDLAARERLFHLYQNTGDVARAVEQRLHTARSRVRAGASEEALELYLEALTMDEGNAEILYEVAVVFADTLGDAATAEKYLMRALQSDPSHKQAMYGMIKLQFDLNKPNDAVTHLCELISASPGNKLVLEHLIAEYTEKQRMQPNDAYAKFALATMLRAKSRIEGDKTCMEDAILIFQQDTVNVNELFLPSCNMLGLCFWEIQAPDSAIKWFRKGLETKGYDMEAYVELQYNLAELYNHQNLLEEAITLYEDVCSVNSAYRDASEKLKQLKQEKKGGGKVRRLRAMAASAKGNASSRASADDLSGDSASVGE